MTSEKEAWSEFLVPKTCARALNWNTPFPYKYTVYCNFHIIQKNLYIAWLWKVENGQGAQYQRVRLLHLQALCTLSLVLSIRLPGRLLMAVLPVLLADLLDGLCSSRLTLPSLLSSSLLLMNGESHRGDDDERGLLLLLWMSSGVDGVVVPQAPS